MQDSNGYVCPTGIHPLAEDCPATPEDLSSLTVPEGCAYYRRFDDTGEALGVLLATAGVLQVDGDHEACTFQLEYHFDGQTVTDGFTLRDGLTADPWCITDG